MNQGWETYGKYFYKGIWADKVSVINTIENQQTSWTDDGKYNLSDDMENRVFTVTISNLTQQDAGTYWCYTHGRVLELKTEVNLTVDRDVVM
ncbi:hypothetical protein DPEC_G00169820 [Dallia pectoralis]|uniref:Uncharacterized protein n=1 Tax=Dallia pectoralis TaxID=75939 RepID=A0ACC2GCM0_DALPE|nr:hypothetical protein DPEC_G00169820 [Dallia pectoralis]